jgi:hypothetical protein
MVMRLIFALRKYIEEKPKGPGGHAEAESERVIGRKKD